MTQPTERPAKPVPDLDDLNRPFFEAADRALYLAKGAGRNRVANPGDA